MLQTTLWMLETCLRASRMNEDEIKKFLSVYSRYTKGKFIYPGAIHHITQISIVKIYDVLNILEEQEWVQSYFEIICTACKHTTGMIYRSLDELPERYECDNCEKEGSTIDSAILIYKVIRDE